MYCTKALIERRAQPYSSLLIILVVAFFLQTMSTPRPFYYPVRPDPDD
jgi:hypothetical protein